MNSLPIKRKFSKEVYNAIPVYYCKQCLSLKIRHIPGMADTDYCDKCNSTNILKTNIEYWEALYEQKYGHKFLDKPKY